MLSKFSGKNRNLLWMGWLGIFGISRIANRRAKDGSSRVGFCDIEHVKKRSPFWRLTYFAKKTSRHNFLLLRFICCDSPLKYVGYEFALSPRMMFSDWSIDDLSSTHSKMNVRVECFFERPNFDKHYFSCFHFSLLLSLLSREKLNLKKIGEIWNAFMPAPLFEEVLSQPDPSQFR